MKDTSSSTVESDTAISLDEDTDDGTTHDRPTMKKVSSLSDLGAAAMANPSSTVELELNTSFEDEWEDPPERPRYGFMPRSLPNFGRRADHPIPTAPKWSTFPSESSEYNLCIMHILLEPSCIFSSISPCRQNPCWESDRWIFRREDYELREYCQQFPLRPRFGISPAERDSRGSREGSTEVPEHAQTTARY